MPLLAKGLSTTLALLGLLFVAVLARAECAVNAPGAGFARIAVSGMPFLAPGQARVGAINGADIRLPQLLVAAMNSKGRHVALDYSHLDLRMLARPRGLFTSHAMDSDVSWDVVERPAAEFVLTGVIENIGLTSDKASSFLGRYTDRSLALMDRRYNQPRSIALVVELFDVASGELVMQKRYEAQANWDFSTNDAMGIDSPRVWQSAYGRELLNFAERVIADIEESLSCAVVSQAMRGS
jgi:hypothetical protein